MADDPKADDPSVVITKDPSKKGFWSIRNIGGLVTLAILSAGGPQAVDSVQNYFALHGRMDDHDVWRAQMEMDVNDKAYWDAFAVIEGKISSLAERIGVLEKLFDREFGRSAGKISKEMEADLKSLREERRMITLLHAQLKEMIKQYQDGNPTSEKPEDLHPLPEPPPPDVAPIEEFQQMQQQAPNQFDASRLKEHYHRRNPKK